MCLLPATKYRVGVDSRRGDGRLFRSFGAQAAKLCGPHTRARRSPRAVERRWWRLAYSLQLQRTAPGGTAVRLDGDA